MLRREGEGEEGEGSRRGRGRERHTLNWEFWDLQGNLTYLSVPPLLPGSILNRSPSGCSCGQLGYASFPCPSPGAERQMKSCYSRPNGEPRRSSGGKWKAHANRGVDTTSFRMWRDDFSSSGSYWLVSLLRSGPFLFCCSVCAMTGQSSMISCSSELWPPIPSLWDLEPFQQWPPEPQAASW